MRERKPHSGEDGAQFSKTPAELLASLVVLANTGNGQQEEEENELKAEPSKLQLFLLNQFALLCKPFLKGLLFAKSN